MAPAPLKTATADALYIAEDAESLRTLRNWMPNARIVVWGSQGAVGGRYSLVVVCTDRRAVDDLWFESAVRPNMVPKAPILRLTPDHMF